MAIVTIDLSALPLSARKTCDEVFRSQTMAEMVLARKRQAELARHFHNHPQRSIEGLGGMNMVFDPFLWCALRRVCNAAPGEDGEVQRWAARKYPIFRVRSPGTKMQVGYWSTPEAGSTGRPSKPKLFSKTYDPTDTMNALIGKHIVCRLESAAGNTADFTAEVQRGRHEGEVHLRPHGEGPKGYVETSRIYVREVLDGPPPPQPKAEEPTPGNITPLVQPAVIYPPPETGVPVVPPENAPTSSTPEQQPSEAGTPGTVEPTLPEAAATPADPVAQTQPELTDDRRLSRSPISPETRRRHARGGPVDHGAKAAQPDEFAEKH